jgi:predicted NBD/HSP70 family sugar kinase
MFEQYPRIQRDQTKRILRIMLKHARVTRARIAHITRLSNSSIVAYTKALIDMGVIRLCPPSSLHSGRRVEYLEFNPSLGVNIVVVLTMRRIHVSLVNPAGGIVESQERQIYKGIPKSELLTQLQEAIQWAKDLAELKLKVMVFGIGISLGGYIDPLRGISHEYLFSSDWNEVPLTDIMKDRFNLPCLILNDANAAALGELHYNAAEGVSNFICIWIGEGIGMGIVVRGELYEGQTSYAGEIGHTKVRGNDQLCYCGRQGCLETIASEEYIVATCREGCRMGVHTELLQLCDGKVEQIAIEHVKMAAAHGDRFTQNILDQVADTLAIKISDAANILDPEMIVLRGPVIDGNPYLFESLRRVALNNTLRPIAQQLTISYAEGSDDNQAKGVSSYILWHYFS